MAPPLAAAGFFQPPAAPFDKTGRLWLPGAMQAPRIWGTLDPFVEGGEVMGRKVANSGFLDALLAEKAVRKEKAFVAVVGMRVDPRTRAAAELERFLSSWNLPVLGHIRDSQLYVQLAANGMTLFDLSAARAGRDLEQWQPILQWIEG